MAKSNQNALLDMLHMLPPFFNRVVQHCCLCDFHHSIQILVCIFGAYIVFYVLPNFLDGIKITIIGTEAENNKQWLC